VSWQPTTDPECNVDPTRAPVDSVIVPRRRDVGGFDVMRALPSAERRAVGPFVFFDQFGPLQLIQGRSLEVRPHPHIGLATVTYVFAGKIMHRDSLGTVQPIQPGEVNWMTAGRGIVHSERTSNAGNPPGAELFGIQTWVALPKSREEIEPAFAHHARAELPEVEGEGVWSRIILGTCFGRSSPVATYADPVYVDCLLGAGARVSLPAEIE
jgi:redox-sensitive bicupin YhaK (pirin superfamily)